MTWEPTLLAATNRPLLLAPTGVKVQCGLLVKAVPKVSVQAIVEVDPVVMVPAKSVAAASTEPPPVPQVPVVGALAWILPRCELPSNTKV